jgi:hypothetical protein
MFWEELIASPFIGYDTDGIENNSNHSALPLDHLYRVVAKQCQRDSQTDSQTVL